MCIVAIDPVSGVSAKVKPRRPRWEDMYAGYPLVNRGTTMENDEPAATVFAHLFGANYDNRVFVNACATRLSVAFNKSGLSVRKDFIISHGTLKGKGIISSAVKLKEWLSRSDVFGKADITIKSPNSFAEISSAIGVKKGIYILESNNYQWATGHATLWYNGHAIGGHDYYSHAKEISFWELK